MKRIIFFTALVAYFLALSKAGKPDEVLTKISLDMKEPNKNMSIVQKWENLGKIMKKAATAAIKMAIPVFMDNSANLNLSKECVQNAMHLISGLRNIKPWAVRFLDSSAKIIDGLLVGTLSSFGSYEECVDTVVNSTRQRDKGKQLFRGQYCMIDIKPPLPPKKGTIKAKSVIDELKNFSKSDTAVAEMAKMAHFSYTTSLRMGICTPSGCSKEDINRVVHLLIDPLSLNATVSRCEVKEENQFPPTVIAVIICYSLAGFLMLVSTIIDIYAYYRNINFKSKSIRILIAFSFFTNFKKFVNTETRSDTLTCLNGVRFLSMSWIIIGHTYFLLNYQLFHGVFKAMKILDDFAFQAMLNATVSVDTFFFIGGLLVCFVTIKLVRQEERKFNVPLYVVHRLWRILPTYSFVIMFVFLMDMFGSGPVWHDTTYKHIEGCYDYWWRNFIFINNFYYEDQSCLFHTWFIAADFQLYIGALLILLPMIKWPKIGILLAILAVITSVVYAGIATYVNSYPPTILLSSPDLDEIANFKRYFYYRPFIHIGPYCIGLLAGYLIATKPDLKIPPLIQVVGWSLAFTFNFSVLYGVAEWNKGVEPTLLATIFYASLNRTVWTLGVAWMIICCATGHGGVINYILSWKAFVPLGRLTYVAYLIHPIVQLSVAGSIKTSLQTDHFIPVWLFLGNLCVTYAAAFAGSMLIESPFMALEKILFNNENKGMGKNPLVIENNILTGTLKTEKNADVVDIVTVTEENCAQVDDKWVVYKL